MRELTISEVRDLRRCMGMPVCQASVEAQGAALAAEFCNEVVDSKQKDNAQFQIACICAMQGGTLEGEDFIHALTDAPIKNGYGKYHAYFQRVIRNYDKLDIWANDLVDAAWGVILSGRKIDIRRLYDDVMDRYNNPWASWRNIPSAVRWMNAIKEYQIKCSRSKHE